MAKSKIKCVPSFLLLMRRRSSHEKMDDNCTGSFWFSVQIVWKFVHIKILNPPLVLVQRTSPNFIKGRLMTPGEYYELLPSIPSG